MVYILTSDYLKHSYVCGHFFEALDIHFMLNRVGIQSQICTFNKNFALYTDVYVKSLYEDKLVDNVSIQYLTKPFYQFDGPVIVTDGALDKVFVRAPSVILCLCSKFDVSHILSDKIFILGDTRFMTKDFIKEKFQIVNEDHLEKYDIIHYVKKIAFDFYKRYDSFDSRCLIYMGNRMKMTESLPILKCNMLTIKNQLPIPNLHKHFDTYIYTPVKRQYDCSNRLIKECQFYNKKIVFAIDYEDIALQIRYEDDLSNVWFTENDDLINLIRDLL